MANVNKNGLAAQISGTIDGITITHHKNGTISAKSKNKPSKIPRTKSQKSGTQCFKRFSKFSSSAIGFLRIGYALEVKKMGYISAFNACMKQAKSAITGEFPNQKIDFPNVLVTKGDMTPPENASVTIHERGLAFSWDPEITKDDQHYSDHAMLFVHFPGEIKSVYKIAGALRGEGKDILLLSDELKGNIGEVYISFIKDEQDAISNSVYLGQVNW